MLVVKLELWPFGREDQKETLGEIKVWNDGTGSTTRGNYEGYVYSVDFGTVNSLIVKYHDRSKSAWHLIEKILKLALRDK